MCRRRRARANYGTVTGPAGAGWATTPVLGGRAPSSGAAPVWFAERVRTQAWEPAGDGGLALGAAPTCGAGGARGSCSGSWPGISVGLACGGDRRRPANRARARPRFERAGTLPDAALLANDPTFDEAKQAAVADAPRGDGRRSVPGSVRARGRGPGRRRARGCCPSVAQHDRAIRRAARRGPRAGPATRRRDRREREHAGPVRAGHRLDDDATSRTRSRPASELPPELVPTGDLRIRQKLRVVGISKSTDDDLDSVAVGGVLRASTGIAWSGSPTSSSISGAAPPTSPKFRADVEKIFGHPVNVLNAGDALRGREGRATSPRSSRVGSCSSRLAVLVGAGALVGQALVRAVTAGASDLPTWRAIGADRRVVVRALVAPDARDCARRRGDVDRRRDRAVTPVPDRVDAQLRARHRSCTPTGSCSGSVPSVSWSRSS